MWSKVKGAVDYARMFSDLESIQRFRRLYNHTGAPAAGELVSKFRVRSLNGNHAYCRTKGSDINVFKDTFFEKYHLPPSDLAPIRKILDLGSNIGLTMAHLACLFPKAQVLGIELDPENVRLCRQNIAPYADRCTIICGAVWDQPGKVRYGGEEEWGYAVTAEGKSDRFADAYTMQSLIQQLGAPVDYVKMDVEGAESVLLKNPDAWIQQVRCMKVEVHDPYTVAECVRDLQRSGFRTVLDTHHPKSVIAYNSVATWN